MDFKEYIKQHDFTITDQELSLCQEGIRHMKSSRDRHHEETHIYRMLTNLPKIMSGCKNVADAAILLAICWHDAWKANQAFSTSRTKFWFDQLYEGIGSARIFTRVSQKIDPMVASKAKRAILVHPRLDLAFPKWIQKHMHARLSPESQILQDLDGLDSCNTEFLENFIKVYDDRFKRHPKYVDVWTTYYRKGFRKIDEAAFHSQAARDIFNHEVQMFRQKADAYVEHIQKYKVRQRN